MLSLHGSLWQENFSFHELTRIVRQKDQQFAQLLNKVCEAQITDEDEARLKQRVITLDDLTYIEPIQVTISKYHSHLQTWCAFSTQKYHSIPKSISTCTSLGKYYSLSSRSDH